MWLDRRRPHANRQLLGEPHRSMLGDAVGEVHQSDRRERKAAVGHQRQMQREREHVRVGRRQRVAQREPAYPVIGGKPVEIDADLVQRKHEIGDLAPAPADERQP
jgi:hypothetical protein